MNRKGTDRVSWAEALLLLVVCVLIFVVMFAHMTAIKNVGIAVAALALVCVRYTTPKKTPKQIEKPSSNGAQKRENAPLSALRAPWPTAGLLLPMALWAVWSAISVGWSVFSEAAVASWLDEVVYPFVAFFAFYRLAAIGRTPSTARNTPQLSQPVRDEHVAGESRFAGYVEISCWLAIVALAALSAMQCFGVTFAAQAPSAAFLHFLGAPIEVSTLALIAMPFFVASCACANRLSDGAMLAMRLVGLSGITLALIVGFWQPGIAFPVCAALTLSIALAPMWRHRAWLGVLSAVVLLAAALLVTPYVGARSTDDGYQRQAEALIVPSTVHTAKPTGLVQQWLGAWQALAHRDTHLATWRFFLEQGQAHPWMGVGFGKPLPAFAYGADAWAAQWPHWAHAPSNGMVTPGTGMPVALQGVSAAMPPTQARNMLLNTWLQLGIVGVLLQAWLWGALAIACLTAGPANAWLKAAGLALIAGVFTNNLLSDVLLQSTLLAFWAHVGWTLGRARLSGLVAGRSVSGRSVAMRRLRRVGN